MAILSCANSTGAAPPIAAHAGDDGPSDAVTAARDADYFLRHEKNFSRAIREARWAVAQSPTTSRYHRTLANALICRASSVARAASYIARFHQDQERFAADLEVWTKAQETGEAAQDPIPKAEEVTGTLSSGLGATTGSSWDEQYRKTEAIIQAAEARLRKIHTDRLGPGSPRPEPPVLRTLDDGQPFDLTKEEAAEEVRQLTQEAASEYDLAISSATNDREKAEADESAAWGMLLVVGLPETSPTEKAPVRELILARIREATRLDAKQPRYWQGLGDLTIRLARLQGLTPDDDIVHAYERVEALTHGSHPDLDMRIVDVLAPPDSPVREDRAARALRILEKLYRREHEDAFPLDRAALILLKTDFAPAEKAARMPENERKALELIERANQRSPRIATYQEAVPPDMAGAFARNSWSVWYQERAVGALAQSIITCYSLPEGSEDKFKLRLLHEMVGMGAGVRSMASNDPRSWSTVDANFERAAMSAWRLSFPKLVTLLAKTGDEVGSKAVATEWYRIQLEFRTWNDQSQSDARFGYGKY